MEHEGDTHYGDARRELADLIAGLVPFGRAENDPQSGVLTAFVVVAELQADDGTRWLSLCTGNGSGSNDLPRWTTEMFGRELSHWTQGLQRQNDDE